MTNSAIPANALTSGTTRFSADDVLAPYVWIFYAAFLVCFFMTPVMRRIAVYYGVVDNPDGLRKMHREPIAYLGGVAIFLGWIVGIVMTLFIGWHIGANWTPVFGEHVRIPIELVVGAFLVVLLGLYDDIFHISAYWKIAGQIIAAIALLTAGIGTTLTGPFVENVATRLPKLIGYAASGELVDWVTFVTSCGLTTGIIVFCCNASNLLDGLDGLCGGVTAIIATGFVVLAVNLALYPDLGSPGSMQRDALRIVLGLALLGATLGFLPFNFNPANIFMGDAGSLFLGFACAIMIILLGEAEARWLLAALVMFSLPVLDTALAFARRKLAGRPLFSPDKQHLHHQLVARGLSVKQAVLTAYAIAIFFVLCGIAIIYMRTRFAVGFYLVLFGFIIVAAYKMGMVHERVVVPTKTEVGGTGIADVPLDDDETPLA